MMHVRNVRNQFINGRQGSEMQSVVSPLGAPEGRCYSWVDVNKDADTDLLFFI